MEKRHPARFTRAFGSAVPFEPPGAPSRRDGEKPRKDRVCRYRKWGARRRKPTGELASLENLRGSRPGLCGGVPLGRRVEGEAGRVGVGMTLGYSYDNWGC